MRTYLSFFHLQLACGVPPRVHEEDPASSSQVERHTSGLEGDEEDGELWVCVEGLDDSRAVAGLHAPVQLHTSRGEREIERERES